MVDARTDKERLPGRPAERKARGRRPKKQGPVCAVCGLPVAPVARCARQGGWRHVGPYKARGTPGWACPFVFRADHAPAPSLVQLSLVEGP